MIALLLGAAMAQDTGGFLADDWRPPLEADGLLAVEGTSLPEGWEARLDGALAHHPLVVVSADGPSPLIGEALSLHASLSGRLGPTRLGLRVPLAAAWGGEALESPAFAAGDPALTLVLSPLAGRPLALGLAAELSLPLGGEALWLGSPGLTGSARLLLDAQLGSWRLALDGGLRQQPEADLVWDSQQSGPSIARQALAAGALARSLGARSTLSVEARAAIGLSPAADPQSTPLELLVGWRRARATGGCWRVGLGAGLLPGVGAPAARIVVGGGARPQG